MASVTMLLVSALALVSPSNSAASAKCPHARLRMQSHGVLQDCMWPWHFSIAGHGAGNSPAISAIVEGAVLRANFASSYIRYCLMARASMSSTA